MENNLWQKLILNKDTKIQISFKLWVFTRPIEVNFILDRKVKVDED